MSSPSSDGDLPIRTIVESLTARLRHEIRHGIIEPGSRLGQLDVARRYGVSTSPVREAFSALEREGLLIRSPHKGVIVFQPQVQDLIETYELRIVLEPLATTKAVPRLSDDDLELLRVTALRMFESSDEEEHFRLNREFHRIIYRSSGSGRLLTLIDNLMADTAAYQRIYGQDHPRDADKRIYDEHMAIYEACLARKPREAATAVARHLQSTVAAVKKSLPASPESSTTRTGTPR